MQRRVCSLIKMSPPITADRGLLSASGATVPTDGTDGYQPSSFFQDTTNGILYINEGSVTSCEFNAVTTGGLADVLTIGAFSSVTQGSGIPISSTQTGAVKVYSDDAGVNINSSVRGLLSRFLLTTDASGSSIRAAMGQLKLADLVDVETGVYTAVQGYVELAGTSIVKANAHFSCFDASLEIASGETLTVNQYGKIAGIYIETTGAGTITVDSGGMCAGIAISKATGAPSWPIGILISGADVIQGINVGSFSSTDASILGVTVATAISAANRFYTDDGATAIVNTGVGDTRGVLSRLLARADHTANPLRLFALEGQLKGYCASSGGAAKWNNEMVAGVYGYMELERASGTMTLGGYGFTAGVMSCVENSGVVTVNTNHVLSGFCAVSKITSDLTATGKTAAFHAAIYDGTNWSSSAEDEQPWEFGLLIQDSATGIGVDVGSCATGINFSGTYTGNVMDFSNATIDPTGSGGPCFIRMGAYGTEIDYGADNHQSGAIRIYTTCSGDISNYDRGVFVCTVTTGAKGAYPVAGLAEANNTGTGPRYLGAAQFIAHLGARSSGAHLASLGGLPQICGMYGAWLKVGAAGTAVCDSGSRVACAWIDSQMSGTISGDEFGIFATTGASRPDAFIGFSTSSSGYNQLFNFDSTFDAGAGTCVDGTQCDNGTQDARIFVYYNGTQYYLALYR